MARKAARCDAGASRGRADDVHGAQYRAFGGQSSSLASSSTLADAPHRLRAVS
ncbi:MAG: hypothetical protein HOH04_17355 [Rhodospirillaceae bacterium]|nr:hypothetical protein [Rhodospirillaceae bacterium]